MKNYNQELDELFEEWEKEFEFTHFFSDGLMYKGEISKNMTWRYPGKENELWEKAEKRVMFLMKDVNAGKDDDNEDNDIRGRFFKDTKVRIYRNMSYWLYGLLKTIEYNQVPEFTFSVSEVTQFFDDTPFSYVNCKKEAGASSVSYSTLVNHIDRDKKFLTKEINILNPDIVICCAWAESTGNPIFDFVKENVWIDIEEINKWMYYSKEKNKLVIDSYHPTTRKSGDAEIYNSMMEAFSDFLTKYPEFLKPCR